MTIDLTPRLSLPLEGKGDRSAVEEVHPPNRSVIPAELSPAETRFGYFFRPYLHKCNV